MNCKDEKCGIRGGNMTRAQKRTLSSEPKFKIGESVYHTQPGGDDKGRARTLYCLRKVKEIKPGFVNSYKFQHGTCFISENVLVSRAVGDRLAKEDPVYHKVME